MDDTYDIKEVPSEQSMGASLYTIYCHTHISSGRKYVGLTKNYWGRRWAGHISKAKRKDFSTNHWYNALVRYGKDAFSHEVLEVCDSLEVANLAEECWIELFDTRNPKKGFNLMKGGGSKPGRPSNAYRSDPAFKAKVSSNSKRLWQDPSFRQKVISSSQAVTTSEPFRQAMSEEVKGFWQDPVFREKNLAAAAASYTPERVEEARRRWDDPSYRERCSSGAQASNETRRSALFCKRGHPRQVDAVTPSGWGTECHQCAYDRRRATRDSCPQGHPYAPSNTRLRTNNTRICLSCESAKSVAKPCVKCGGPKLRKSGSRFRCGPCTDTRISAWKAKF